MQSYDLAHRLRESGLVLAGGFHSPMEREWLQVLLKGPAPVILCPARHLAKARLPLELRRPLEEGRLLLLSPFPRSDHRATLDTALFRNRFVAALAGLVFTAYAEPGGKTEQLCREVLARGKPLCTFESDANANLLALGATPMGLRGSSAGEGMAVSRFGAEADGGVGSAP